MVRSVNCELNSGLDSFESTKAGLFCFEFFFLFSQIYLSAEKLTQKKLSSFENLFNSQIIKFTVVQKKPFGTWQFGEIGA